MSYRARHPERGGKSMVEAMVAMLVTALGSAFPATASSMSTTTKVLAGPIIVQNSNVKLGDFQYVVYFRVNRDPLTVPRWLRTDAYVNPAKRRGDIRIGGHAFEDQAMSRYRRLANGQYCIAYDVERERKPTVTAPVGTKTKIQLKLFNKGGRLGKAYRRTTTVQQGSPSYSTKPYRKALGRIGC